VQGRQIEGHKGRMGSLKGIEWKSKNKAQSKNKQTGTYLVRRAVRRGSEWREVGERKK